MPCSLKFGGDCGCGQSSGAATETSPVRTIALPELLCFDNVLTSGWAAVVGALVRSQFNGSKDLEGGGLRPNRVQSMGTPTTTFVMSKRRGFVHLNARRCKNAG